MRVHGPPDAGDETSEEKALHLDAARGECERTGVVLVVSDGDEQLAESGSPYIPREEEYDNEHREDEVVVAPSGEEWVSEKRRSRRLERLAQRPRLLED